VCSDEKGAYLVVRDIGLKCDDALVRLRNHDARGKQSSLLGTIRIESIQVDAAYYDGIDEEWIEARTWNLMFAGSVVINRRPDGTYWVLDGRHRLLLAVRAGVERHVCQVHQIPIDQEARYHELLNTRYTDH
jgi:hypothetical protein